MVVCCIPPQFSIKNGIRCRTVRWTRRGGVVEVHVLERDRRGGVPAAQTARVKRLEGCTSFEIMWVQTARYRRTKACTYPPSVVEGY